MSRSRRQRSEGHVEFVGVRAPVVNGKRMKARGEIVLGELLVIWLHMQFLRYFPHEENRSGIDRDLRGFIFKIMAEKELPVLDERDQQEAHDLYKALLLFDTHKSEVRHCSWDNFLNLLSKFLGGATHKPGVGLVMTEGIDDVTQGETKLALFEEANQKLEELIGQSGEEGVEDPVFTHERYHEHLRMGPQGEEYDHRPSHTPEDCCSEKIREIDKTIEELERRLKTMNPVGQSELKQVQTPDAAPNSGANPSSYTWNTRGKTSLQVFSAVEQRILAKPPTVPKDSFLRKGPMTNEQEGEVDDAFHGGAASQILVRAFNAELSRQQLQCLLPCTWLNDEVVNMYMKLLDARDKELCEKDPSRRRSHFFSSFFLTKLRENNRYSYKGVKRWTRKIKVFEMDKIFFPVNVSNMHWCMAVIYVQEKRINFHDSMGGSGLSTTSALMKWLEDEDDDKNGDNGTFNVDEWTVAPPDKNTPQQHNGSDCGAFAVAFASYVSDNLPFDFSQADIAQMRRRMLWSILNQSLV